MEITHLSTSERMIYPVGDYLSENYDIFDSMTESIINILENYPNIKAINFWTTGSSGPIVASFIIPKLKKDYKCSIVHIKKVEEISHSRSFPIAGNTINIITDDFICSGKSIERIFNAMMNDYSYFIWHNVIVCVSGYVPEDTFVRMGFEPDYLICGYN